MKNIILIGFMACGKSSVGKRLAQALNMEFLDTDELIEQKAGTTISDIFATQGEAAFRVMETECLKDLLGRSGEAFVLSVGGGLPIREENRRLLKQIGMVVYLNVSAETVFARVRNDKTRPLLQTPNPRGRIMDLMGARKQFYADAADVIIEADDKSFDTIIEEIKESGK